MSFNTVIVSGGSDKVNTAVLNQIHVDGVFVKTTPMGTAPNVVYRIGDGTVHAEGWDNVLDNEYLDFYISYTSDADFEFLSLVGANIVDIGTVATNIAEILLADDNATVATTQAGIATTQATNASSSATQAQLSEWVAEAERLTADSYATEAEDTFVNLVTSDGDGTFTYTPTTDYSALHWAAKSMTGDIAPIIHAATAKTTPVDADEFAITDSAATFGLKKLTWANLKLALFGSPALTGTPTAPTAATGTNTTQLATTAFVNTEIANDAVLNTGGTMTGAITALRETKIAMGANDIALASGNVFTKTITATTTLTVSGWLASGNANSFILELTNGGAFAVTYFAGVKWAGGIAPTLTAAGVDILGFYSHDGGTTIRGIVLAKDSK